MVPGATCVVPRAGCWVQGAVQRAIVQVHGTWHDARGIWHSAPWHDLPSSYSPPFALRLPPECASEVLLLPSLITSACRARCTAPSTSPAAPCTTHLAPCTWHVARGTTELLTTSPYFSKLQNRASPCSGEGAGVLSVLRGGTRSCYHAPNRYLILLICSRRILDSSVDAGTPSRSAAPRRPETRPRVSRNISSMIRRS